MADFLSFLVNLRTGGGWLLKLFLLTPLLAWWLGFAPPWPDTLGVSLAAIPVLVIALMVASALVRTWRKVFLSIGLVVFAAAAVAAGVHYLQLFAQRTVSLPHNSGRVVKASRYLDGMEELLREKYHGDLGELIFRFEASEDKVFEPQSLAASRWSLLSSWLLIWALAGFCYATLMRLYLQRAIVLPEPAEPQGDDAEGVDNHEPASDAATEESRDKKGIDGEIQEPEKYDVAVSYASDDRPHAEKLAKLLRRDNYSVFYDEFEKSKLWGKDLSVFLHEVYSKRTRYFVVVFVSQHYSKKIWTVHEFRSALEQALELRGREYILPVRLDDTNLDGLRTTVAHLSIDIGIADIYRILREKIDDRRKRGERKEC